MFRVFYERAKNVIKANLFLSLCFFVPFQFVFSDILNTQPLKVKNISVEEKTFSPNEKIYFSLHLDLAPEHHAYEDKFELEVISPLGFKLESLKASPLVNFYDKNFNQMKRGISSGESKITGVLTSPPYISGRVQLNLKLTYQACTSKYCLLPVDVFLKQDIEFKKADHFLQILSSKDTNIFKKILEQGLWITLGFLFLAGILTSFTPCILPMIPITLSVLKGNKETKKIKGFLLSLSYVLGIAFTYSFLGVFAASSGFLFGSFLGNIYFVIFISLIFFFMGLSLLGVFEISPPTFLLNFIQNKKFSQGHWGAFVAGLTAGFIATPCVGPVLVSVLAYVSQTKNLIFGFFSLFVFALGMGVLFLILGTFSQWTFPKTGRWILKIQALLGVFLILLAVYTAYPVVKMHFPEFMLTELKQNLSWKPYNKTLYKQALKDKKPIVIYFWAEWCLSCKELSLITFSNEKVKEESKGFVLLKFDATSSSFELKELSKKYNVVGLPHLLFYSPKGKHLREMTLTGFEGPKKFTERLKKIKKAK